MNVSSNIGIVLTILLCVLLSILVMLTPLSCLFISYYFCTTLFSLYIIIIYWNLFSRRRSHVVLLLYQWIGNRLWTHQAVFHLSLRPFVITVYVNPCSPFTNEHGSFGKVSISAIKTATMGSGTQSCDFQDTRVLVIQLTL